MAYLGVAPDGERKCVRAPIFPRNNARPSIDEADKDGLRLLTQFQV